MGIQLPQWKAKRKLTGGTYSKHRQVMQEFDFQDHINAQNQRRDSAKQNEKLEKLSQAVAKQQIRSC